MESTTLLSSPATKSLLTLSTKTLNPIFSCSFTSQFKLNSSAQSPPHILSHSPLTHLKLQSFRSRDFRDLTRVGFGSGQKQLRVEFGSAAASATDDGSASASDVIVLRVGGMMCEGCTSSVKKILESRPQVSSATVDLSSGTATIWPVSETKAVADWQKQVGEELAKHVTNCGFESSFLGQEAPTGS